MASNAADVWRTLNETMYAVHEKGEEKRHGRSERHGSVEKRK